MFRECKMQLANYGIKSSSSKATNLNASCSLLSSFRYQFSLATLEINLQVGDKCKFVTWLLPLQVFMRSRRLSYEHHGTAVL
jgi:hypothetical protein